MAHECPVCLQQCDCKDDHCVCCVEKECLEADSNDQFDDDQPQQEQEHHGTLYWEDFDAMERMPNPNLL